MYERAGQVKVMHIQRKSAPFTNSANPTCMKEKLQRTFANLVVFCIEGRHVYFRIEVVTSRSTH